MSGKKHWKTIYKEVEKPVLLYSDDGHFMIVSGKYTRLEAFELIKQELQEQYGDMTDEYYNLKDSDQLEVALLRRPDRNNDYEDMSADYYAEKIIKTEPNKNQVWMYSVDTTKFYVGIKTVNGDGTIDL